MESKTIRVALVEDDEGTRAVVSRVITKAPQFALAAVYPDAESALAGLPDLKPDVVVMDLKLPGMDGVACTAALRDALPETQILVLTSFGDGDSLFESLRAGASGYMLKRSSPEEIVEAIQLVSEGGSPMSGDIARKVVESFRSRKPGVRKPLESLTSREEEILSLLAKGHVAKEISEMLDISFTTVRFHIRHIYKKLHVRSKTEAVLKFLR
ncbi:MAG: response regulator transcription factor [Kiritimatiellia bacterium]